MMIIFKKYIIGIKLEIHTENFFKSNLLSFSSLKNSIGVELSLWTSCITDCTNVVMFLNNLRKLHKIAVKMICKC